MVALVLALGGCAAGSGTPVAGALTRTFAPGGDAAFAPTGSTADARVVRIVDGDTIVVRLGGRDVRLRYIGMDTPETKKSGTPVQWMGPQAAAANAALVEGRDVVLERDVSETDRYGRLLRYVWLRDGARWTLVNLELVARGYAHIATYPPDVKYVDRFLAAERAAREAGEGLWGPHPSAEP
jgi:micrococcal nuclease